MDVQKVWLDRFRLLLVSGHYKQTEPFPMQPASSKTDTEGTPSE